jgi:hypothetical protein
MYTRDVKKLTQDTTMKDLSKTLLGKLELASAIAMTAASAYLHVRFLTNAGGLWRDEVVSTTSPHSLVSRR